MMIEEINILYYESLKALKPTLSHADYLKARSALRNTFTASKLRILKAI